MYLDYLLGEHDLAIDIYKKNPEYAFIELYEHTVGANTIFGMTYKKNKKNPVGVIISFDCWQCSNERGNLKCLYEDLAEYMYIYKDIDVGIILVGPDEEEIKKAVNQIQMNLRSKEESA